MRAILLVGSLSFGLLSGQAQALELGLGAGRIQGCLARVADEDALCSMGPAMTLSFGLNLWGAGYRPGDREVRAFDSSVGRSNFDSGWRWNASVNRWEEVLIIVAVGLLITTVIYAFMYPFSSRMDIGVVGRSGWQQQSGADLQLWRNEAGLYLRAYLSQHFPMYIYGSGMFSHQNLTLAGREETHQVFVKGLGFGFMSPTQGGLYLHGVWERSSFIDPKVRDLVEDASEVKMAKNSVASILDGSYFELGYIWYL
ncbi:hypothetical protein [Oligoflexus tunisiensis]|uniref:hypothetical protein n=1 Tax=Oligoflexus tunisiensis TaxID=708132 RepID=UPI00114D2A1C|nr:hypothetical protein [Oligoflexus tunisiensis]